MHTFAESNNHTAKMNYRKEHIIYISLWILLYIAPVTSLYMRMSNNPDIDFSWNEILNAWFYVTVWLATFAIHNYLLVPLLIVKRKTWRYMGLALALLLVGMTVLYINRPSPDDFRQRQHHRMEHREKYCQRRDPADSMRMARIRLGDGRSCRPEDAMRRRHELRPMNPVPMLGPGEMVAFFGGILLMGMNIGVKLYFKSMDDREKQESMAKHNLEQQMEYLKYQVNPHFFMNTLNNIHALVDINPERAKSTIVELSKMMRYLLYDGAKEQIPLKVETAFITNYVKLMRLRYPDTVSISLDVPQHAPDRTVPPLLLITFVENAFKHGVSYQRPSFISIGISADSGTMRFYCSNSKAPAAPGKQQGGVGLVNAKKRLNLIYGNGYTLDIDDGADTFTVSLVIPFEPQGGNGPETEKTA